MIVMVSRQQRQQVSSIPIFHEMRIALLYQLEHAHSIYLELFWYACYVSLLIMGNIITVRACRNAIEFNSIPSIGRLVPGGYDKLELDIILAVPPKYQSSLDLNEVEKVFPYGKCKFTIQDGGMVAPSCIAIESLGDKNEDMVIVCASIRVGY